MRAKIKIKKKENRAEISACYVHSIYVFRINTPHVSISTCLSVPKKTKI